MGETVGYLIFRGDGKHFEAAKLISSAEKVLHKLTVLRGTLWSYPEVLSNQKLACLLETDSCFVWLFAPEPRRIFFVVRLDENISARKRKSLTK